MKLNELVGTINRHVAHDNTSKALELLFHFVEGRLAAEDPEGVAPLLQCAGTDLPAGFNVSVLRSTFRVRRFTKNNEPWRSLANRTFSELCDSDGKENATRRMVGLIKNGLPNI